MNILKVLSLAIVLSLSLSLSAFAGVFINSPGDGEYVTSPFVVSANASTCSSQPVSAMGFSLDNGADIKLVNGQSLRSQAYSGSGWHRVHVKAWGNNGALCLADVTVNVTAGSYLIPSWATSVGALQTLGNWEYQHDAATAGWSSGAMVMTGSPSLTGRAREFYTVYGNYGGERYHVSVADDQSATNFMYDAWIYLTGSAGNIANLELDLNQVMSNGQTVIMGMQCDGYSYTWDYNANWTGPSHPTSSWMHSSAPCNLRSWGRNQWHHIQLVYSHTAWGVVTYHSVWVDGLEEPIDATAPCAYDLGWGPVLLANFQVDGLGASGSITLFLDDFTIYRW